MKIEDLIIREEYKRLEGVIYNCRQQNQQELTNLFCADFIERDELLTIRNRIDDFYDRKMADLDKQFGV